MKAASRSISGRRASSKAATRKKAARPSTARNSARKSSKTTTSKKSSTASGSKAAQAVKKVGKTAERAQETVKKAAKQTVRKTVKKPVPKPAKIVKKAAKKAKQSVRKAATRTTRSIRKAAEPPAKKSPRKTAKKATMRRVSALPAEKPGKTPQAKSREKAKPPAKKSPRKSSAPPAAGFAPEPKKLRASFLEIVRRTSAELPEDVVRAVEKARKAEATDSNALWAMKVIEENIDLAREKSLPLCQDTGTIIFYIKVPRGFDENQIRGLAEKAVAEATAVGYLRQNSVDSLTGKNSGNNLGPGSPVFHFHQWDRPGMEVRLILKGGGCENVGAQYSLPSAPLGAGRDLAGVEKVILDAVHQAQGKGCGPGILGVAVGGDRATGYVHSKEQLLRSLDDTNPNPELAALEKRIVEKADDLEIGPMGFGGSTTLLGCKIGAINRLPASFFVSISYMCWAYRRQGAKLGPDGALGSWLY